MPLTRPVLTRTTNSPDHYTVAGPAPDSPRAAANLVFGEEELATWT